MRARLEQRQRDALVYWVDARSRMPWRITEAEWDAFLGDTARPLTWQLWELADEEARKVYENGDPDDDGTASQRVER